MGNKVLQIAGRAKGDDLAGLDLSLAGAPQADDVAAYQERGHTIAGNRKAGGAIPTDMFS